MTPEPISGFALSSVCHQTLTGGRRWITDVKVSAQGPFFHPKDAMRHNVDISGAWTTFVLDKSEGFTQADVECLNDSIHTHVWAI